MELMVFSHFSAMYIGYRENADWRISADGFRAGYRGRP